ncbi:MAG: rRNA pseudouridine synthase [Lachnospiraceae bacterium]|nr:rRNA pseudouridine synthase [Lachnospiraceae bacterium]
MVRERLDKRLAQEGYGTRSEIRKAVRAGKVSVNGHTEKDPGRQVTPEDEILFAGERVGGEACVYYMLNKPAGVITATEDAAQRTVLDLLRSPETQAAEPVRRRGIFPVGRLDVDTEGLVLITDDGQLAHRLLAPGRHVDKVYYALVSGTVTEEDVRLFADGMQVGVEGSRDAFRALPAELRIAGSAGGDGWNGMDSAEKAGGDSVPVDGSGDQAADRTDGDRAPGERPGEQAAGKPAGKESEELRTLIPADVRKYLSPEITEYTQTLVTIREGKYHQIKRMFAAVGKEVLYLKRLSMGTLRLDPALEPGQFRKLTEAEIRQLQE